MPTSVRALFVGVLLTLALAACGGGATPTATPPPATPAPATPAPATPAPATPSPAPSAPIATPTAPATGVVVTFAVVEEEYRILLTDPADIAIAQQLLAGEEAPSIPSGLIVRGETGVNEGWSWSIDPESVEFADMTIEVCDGLPSHIEDGTLTGDRYCPWSAEVIAIEPAA